MDRLEIRPEKKINKVWTKRGQDRRISLVFPDGTPRTLYLTSLTKGAFNISSSSCGVSYVNDGKGSYIIKGRGKNLPILAGALGIDKGICEKEGISLHFQSDTYAKYKEEIK